MSQLTIHSKHMIEYVQKEEQRIRREIIGAAWLAFHQKGYRLTVSCDSDSENKTEKTVASAQECFDAIMKAGYGQSAWLFVYPAKDKRLHQSPISWVRFTPENVEDVITDYHINAEAILAPVNKLCGKYY